MDNGDNGETKEEEATPEAPAEEVKEGGETEAAPEENA